MPGDPVLIVGDVGGRIRAFVDALRRFPAEPPFVVVGGFAVNVRVAQVHRSTNDLDTVTKDQPGLVELLLTVPDAESLSQSRLRFSDVDVDIDVMDDAAAALLPAEESDRMFALARRFAMTTSEPLTVVVIENEMVVAECSAPFASPEALVVMKAVSLPRRASSPHPEKAASDAHDLVRLIETHDLDALAEAVASTDERLARWVGKQLLLAFSADMDQRYTLVRLQRLSSAVDARSMTADRLAPLAMFAGLIDRRISSDDRDSDTGLDSPT